MDCAALKIEGFDEAIVGISDVWDSSGKKEERFIYNGETLAMLIMNRNTVPFEEALEYIAFNIEGAYVGPNTPVVVWPINGEDE